MHKNFLSVCGVALIGALGAANAVAGDTLTGSEIQQLLAGKTVAGRAGKTKQFIKIYGADGTYRLEVDGKKWEGGWRVTADKYCQTQSDKEQCYTVKPNHDSYQMLSESGEVHTTFTLK